MCKDKISKSELEEIINKHVMIVQEMRRRGMKHICMEPIELDDAVEFKNKIIESKMRELPNLNGEHNDKLESEKKQGNENSKKEIPQFNYYKDYEDKLDYLKKIEFSEKYKSVVESFLSLYETYLNKLLSKVYDGEGMVLKPQPDITENYIRIRIRNPKTIVEGTFRTITISESEGIKAVIGKLRKNPTGPTHIQSVLFQKDKWTVERAQAWVNSHKEDLKNLLANDFKEKKEENTEKSQDKYIDSGYIQEDKDTGKQEPKWVWCKNCEQSFDYFKQLLDDKSTVLCPHCGALVIFEEKE